jgi:hypothetical protein
MTESSDPVSAGLSLTAIRRFYFYAVALISLIVGLSAMDSLLAILSDIWVGDRGTTVGMADYWRNVVARNGGLLLVATPVFLLHWGYIQRRLTDVDERQAGLRKLFLYGASGVALGFAAVRGYDLLASAGYLTLGGALAASQALYGTWPHLIAMTGAGLALTAYFQHILRDDGDYGDETTWAGTVLRLFLTILGLVGLVLVILGSARMLEALWQLVLGQDGLVVQGDWLQRQVSDGLGMLLIGALMLHRSWQSWQLIIDRAPHEAATALRRFYLYAAVVISALAVLAPAAMLLRELLLMLFGSGGGSTAELLAKLGMPISFVPAGLIGWFWYRRYLRQEAERYGESAEAATIRRIYYYAVAATALVLFWLGLVEILSALLDALMNRNAMLSSEQIWANPLATGLSLIAVSGPIWMQHWRTVQTVARQTDEAGHQERNSAPRKIYLYGVALAGALLVLFNTSQVLYRLLLLALGEPGVDFFTAQTANEIAQGLVAIVLWTVHVLAIRGDGQLEAAYEATYVATGERQLAAARETRAQLTGRIATLERELAQARHELAALDAEIDQASSPSSDVTA